MTVNIGKLRQDIRNDQARLTLDRKRHIWIVAGSMATAVIGSCAALTLIFRILGLLK